MWDMTSVYVNEGFKKGRSAGFADGRTAGYNAGILDGSLNTARNMRKKGMSDDVIIEITGLPLSALENL